jgi:hypothetical protein
MMSEPEPTTPKTGPLSRRVVVLGDVEVESIIMRDPEAAVVPISDRATASAGRPAYFYFRMPGGAWMLEETIEAALKAATFDQPGVRPESVGGFKVGWRMESDAAGSVWPTLAPRSAIEIDLYPRVPASEKDRDEKDKVFRIRHGHVNGWMQRAIEGLPRNVADMLNVLRAFGVCYEFYSRELTSDLAAGRQDPECQAWLETLKTTFFAYIADHLDQSSGGKSASLTAPAIRSLAAIGNWLKKVRKPVPEDDLRDLKPAIEEVLKYDLGRLDLLKHWLDDQAGTAKQGSDSDPNDEQEKPAAVTRTRQVKVVVHLQNRIRDFRDRLPSLMEESVTDRRLITEFILVISMKVRLVELSIRLKDLARQLTVKEAELTEIGNQLWGVCNELCISYTARVERLLPDFARTLPGEENAEVAPSQADVEENENPAPSQGWQASAMPLSPPQDAP